MVMLGELLRRVDGVVFELRGDGAVAIERDERALSRLAQEHAARELGGHRRAARKKSRSLLQRSLLRDPLSLGLPE